MSQGDQARYRIGDQMFNDLPALLNFYKVFEIFYIQIIDLTVICYALTFHRKIQIVIFTYEQVHYLDTTPLIRPAQKRIEKVLAKYDFDGNVSFKKC